MYNSVNQELYDMLKKNDPEDINIDFVNHITVVWDDETNTECEVDELIKLLSSKKSANMDYMKFSYDLERLWKISSSIMNEVSNQWYSDLEDIREEIYPKKTRKKS